MRIRRPAPGDGTVALLLATLAFGLYAATLAPGTYWGDSAQLQLATDRPAFSLSARAYPLWVAAASVLRRATGTAPALAANLFSALAGAAAVALAFLAAARLGAGRRGAVLSAAAVAVSHLHWSASVVAEVYSLAAALILLQLLVADRALVSRRSGPFAFGVLTGLCLLHHRMLLVTAAALGGVLLARWRRERRAARGTVLALVGLAAGVVPIALLAVANGQTGRIGAFFLGSFSLRLPGHLGTGSGLLGLLLYEARFLLLNLAGPAVVLAAAAHLPRFRPVPSPLLPALVAAGLGEVLLFPHIGDRYVLLLPAVLALSILAGVTLTRIGLSARAANAAIALALLVPTGVYGLLSGTGLPRAFGLFRGAADRHVATFLWPGKRGTTEPAEFARRVLRTVPDDAVVLSGWGEGAVLEYEQAVSGLAPGVHVVSSFEESRLDGWRREARGRPVYRTAFPLIPHPPPVHPGVTYREVLPGALWECSFAR